MDLLDTSWDRSGADLLHGRRTVKRRRPCRVGDERKNKKYKEDKVRKDRQYS